MVAPVDHSLMPPDQRPLRTRAEVQEAHDSLQKLLDRYATNREPTVIERLAAQTLGSQLIVLCWVLNHSSQFELIVEAANKKIASLQNTPPQPAK